MELTVAKKDLLKVVQRMQGVAERKSTMPILSNVLLAADGADTLRLAATDLQLSLAGQVHASVKKPGSVAVSAKDLAERVKMMPEGPIVITTQDNATTTLKAQGSARRYTLRGMPGAEFPRLPEPAEGAPSLSLDVALLAELIQKTHFSISTDETRPHLNSAQLEWDGDIVRMVTTDAHRLSKVDVRVPGNQATETMLIPLKAIQELRRICEEILADPGSSAEKGKRELVITQSGSSAFFQGGGLSFSVKLVDAQFPSYAQVIPKSADKIVRAPRVAFADALKAVAVAASDRTGGVKLAVTKGSMLISSESPESGDGSDEVPVDYSGANLSIGFNAKYFLDVLGAISEDEVDLCLSGELDPAVLRLAGSTPEADKQFLAVIMPMRI